MIRYPKLPKGPSPAGAAGVRALQAGGGAFQRKRARIGHTSFQEGPFQKVVVDGIPEYVTTFGYFGDSIDAAYGTMKYKKPYKKTKASAFKKRGSETRTIHCGGNNYLFSEIKSFAQTAYTTTYDNDPISVPPLTVDRAILTNTIQFAVKRVGYKLGLQDSARDVIELEGKYIIFGNPVWERDDTLIQQGLRMAYLGTYREKNAMFAILPVLTGRVDGKGRDIQDLEMVVFATDGSGVLDRRVIGVPPGRHAETEYVYPPTICVTENKVHLLVSESGIYYGATDPGRDYLPRAWVVEVGKADITTYSMADAGAIGLESAFLDDVPPDHFWFPWQTGYFGLVQSRNAYARTVALPGDVSLHFWEDPEWGSITGTGFPYRDFSIMCVRISGSGAAVTLNVAVDFPALNYATYGISERRGVNSVVHLGEGTVLAKLNHIIPRINAPTHFLKSTNGGVSWSLVAPTGFDQPLTLGQHFGSMTLHKAIKDGEPGTVFLPSWSGTAYHIYESKDVGATWAKAGKIKDSDTFYGILSWDRVEQVFTELTSPSNPEVTRGFFEYVLPGPATAVPADKALPDRYKG